MNTIFLIGNLTRAPELGATPNGVSVAKMNIAVSRKFTNSEGERETDFFNVVAWRGLAENCQKFLKKGNKIAVIGSLQTRSYEDSDGNKRVISEVVAQDIEFLTPKANGEGERNAYRPNDGAEENKTVAMEEVENEEDLPF